MNSENKLLIILMAVGMSIPISIFLYFEFQIHEANGQNVTNNTNSSFSDEYTKIMNDRIKDVIERHILDMIIPFAYGQEIDPNAYCSINQYPYIQYCNDQKIHDIMEELLERAKEYNRLAR